MISVLTTLGGLGLFLIGMQVLTEGLRGLAGEALRRVLIGFTRSPLSGAVTGAASTAVIQSSSATTVAAVGFVGAGLLTFNQALGIVFGANVGTTITGWIVAVIGFKLELTSLVLPLSFVGALLKLFARGRIQHAGWALAGFSLVFIGIATLQSGMSAWESVVTPTSFPSDTLLGRLQLVLIGVLITVVTQSSSAGVATALVALGVGAISFNQAAAMVIGMDVGTTFTAALATLGGSTAMRRTGYAHVIYNMMTGVMAFALLTPYTALASLWLSFDQPGDAQIAVVAFHTTFNALGVIVVIGFTRQFAKLITRIVPDRDQPVLSALDEGLLGDPAAATDAMAGVTRHLARSLFKDVSTRLSEHNGRIRTGTDRADTIDEIMVAVTSYAASIKAEPGSNAHIRLQSILHALDHIVRLHERSKDGEAISSCLKYEDLADDVAAFRTGLDALDDRAITRDWIAQLNRLRQTFRRERERIRLETIEEVAKGDVDPETALATFNGMRWLHRSAYHVWRISFHLSNATADKPAALTLPEERRMDAREETA